MVNDNFDKDGLEKIIATGVPDDDYKPPSYSDKGWALIHVLSIDTEAKYSHRYEIEVLEWDGSSSVMWLEEGQGIEYWASTEFTFDRPGVYLISGINGHYIKGTWGYTDDDEEWYYEKIYRFPIWKLFLKWLLSKDLLWLVARELGNDAVYYDETEKS